MFETAELGRKTSIDLASDPHVVYAGGVTPISRCAAVAAALALSLTGCSTTTSKLRTRFAKERGCTESEVRVTESGGMVYRASGCGQATEYVCGTFANVETSARPCEERGLPRKATPGGDPPPFPEAADRPAPPGGPSR